MKVATNEEMRSIDKRAIEEYKIPGIVLMENAAIGVFMAAREVLNGVKNKSVIIFAGKGNNGGDGFAVARHLFNAGARVKVFVTASVEDIAGDAGINLDIITKMGIEIIEVIDNKDLTKLNKAYIEKADLIIDALLGTGIRGEVRSPYREIINCINSTNVYVISVDIPSGINGDTGEICGTCVKADRTVTFALPKMGLVLYPGADYVGRLDVVDISIPKEVIEVQDIKRELVTEEWAKSKIPLRTSSSHKGDYGRVFIIAGSRGLTGAAHLCCMGALRSGAGLITLGVPESLNPIMEMKLTEVMTRPLKETDEGTLSREGLGEITDLIDSADVVALGPGISTHEEVKHVVYNLVEKTPKPMVVDADGLNCLAQQPEVLAKRKWDAIITPHPGELARLMKTDTKTIQRNRIGWARAAAERFGCIVVLKGARTVIASSEGMVYINSSGNPGMASGGTGDVLTGIIAALLGQGISPLDAAVLGVYLHGRAGDLAAEKHGQTWMAAREIYNNLDRVFLELEK